jgi:hypothetical protein
MRLVIDYVRACACVSDIYISACLGVINLLKPTGYVMHQQYTNSRTVCSAHTVFMCFVFT